MDRRHYDRDRVNKMYDIIELLYILNRLTNEFYEDDYSKGYLIDMVDNMENLRHNYHKYKRKDKVVNYGCYCSKKNGLMDKIIFYLKSLNDV
ncbi:MAG: hypothetical protein GX339_02785 [Tissierellia bacterium]|nr:hypothetical protein [Tissierellia bacterium]